MDITLHIPESIARSLRIPEPEAGWLRSRLPTDSNLISLLMVELHRGEAEAIALALELKADKNKNFKGGETGRGRTPVAVVESRFFSLCCVF